MNRMFALPVSARLKLNPLDLNLIVKAWTHGQGERICIKRKRTAWVRRNKKKARR